MKKNQSVKVAIRVRPRNQREKDLNSPVCVQCRDNIIAIRNETQTKQFPYDYVFSSESKQQQIYEAAAFSLVQNVNQGYNATVFAYGQTGAGKTFTMVGVPQSQELKGIIPRTFAHFMNIIQSGQSQQYLLRVSFIEIYNQQIKDLLYDRKKQKQNKRDLKESPDRGVFVKDLIMIPCKSIEEMDKLLDYGNLNRTTAETKMNATSSRSHAIFTVYFETSNEVNGKTLIKAGKLNLVDLAGSQRANKTGATGDTLKEGSKINLSLGALGNVINALCDGKKGGHIPYRDSKLTRLLQDSLGGNTKTIMIASVSPARDNYDETVGTLRYASRAKNIKNAPKINQDPKDALIRQYAQEIKKLKSQLEGLPTQNPQIVIESFDSQSLKKQIQQKLKQQLQSEKNEIILQKEKEKLELIEKIKQMEAAILKKNQLALSPAKQKQVTQRKKKKRKIQKQEEIIADKINEQLTQKENLLNSKFEVFKDQTEQIKKLKELVIKLRAKYSSSLQQIDDLQRQFQVERELYNDSVRQLEKQLSFYKGVCQFLLNDSQIEIIKGESSYQEEKRQYKIPPFLLKQEKMHFPKSLSSQQILDLVIQQKSKRKLELIKLQPIEKAQSSSYTKGFQAPQRRIFKIPDYTNEIYQEKSYNIQDNNLFKQQKTYFGRTNAFRVTTKADRPASRSRSNRQKLQPLNIKLSEVIKRDNSSKSRKLQPIKRDKQ